MAITGSGCDLWGRADATCLGRVSRSFRRGPPRTGVAGAPTAVTPPATAPVRSACAGGADMVGARVEMVQAGATTHWRRARSDGSYASANDPRVLVGLGESTTPP